MFIYRRTLFTLSLPYTHILIPPPHTRTHTHTLFKLHTHTCARTQSHTPALFSYIFVAPVKATIKSCTCSLKGFFLATHKCFFDTLFCSLRGRYRRGKKRKTKPHSWKLKTMSNPGEAPTRWEETSGRAKKGSKRRRRRRSEGKGWITVVEK